TLPPFFPPRRRPPRSPLLPYTTLFRSRGLGIPLVGAVAQVVDTAQVDQRLEPELVTQRAAGVEPVPGSGDAHFAARHRDGDVRAGEAFAQPVGERGGGFPGDLLSHCAAPSSHRRSWSRGGSSSVAAGCRRPGPRPWAGTPARRRPPAPRGRS